jgi:hypothetical protein
MMTSHHRRYTGAEDPFVFLDSRGYWHLLVHRYRFSDGPGVAPADILVAGHGYSLDGRTWQFNKAQPFNSLIVHTTGPPTPSAFERTQAIFRSRVALNRTSVCILTVACGRFNTKASQWFGCLKIHSDDDVTPPMVTSHRR